MSVLAYGTPDVTNFQAHIAKPDGTDLDSSAVNFTFKYKNEAGTCTLYTETYLGVDMTGSGGDVSIQLGSGAPSFPVAGFSLKDILSNATTNTMNCVEGGNYTPTLPTEKRQFVVEFSYAGSNGTQTLPAAEITSVPYSMYASDAENLGGFAANLYAKFSDVTTCAGGQFLTFNGTVFSCAAPGAPVNFTGALSGDVTGTQSATVVSSLRGRPLSVAVPASGEVLTFDGTTWVPMGVAGAAGGTVTSVTSTNLYLSVVSSTSTPALTVNVGQAANTVAAGDDARIVGAWQAGSALSGDVTGTLANNTVSTVGGKTAAQVNTSVNDTLAATSLNTPSTIVKRDASGDVTVSRASAVDFAGRNFLFYDSGVNKITVKSPNVLTSGDYTLTLPDGTGTNGYVLSTNGAGVTSWIPAATGSVTNVTATAPVQSSGGATPNITLAKATAGADGYLASTDWTIFNNKQNTLAAANAATDGYLTSADWSIFNSKQAALVKSDATHDGFLASTDWTTFNNKQNTLAAANAATDGYLTSSDWTTFNNKQATLAQANSTTDGYLASTDWSVFNNKQNNLGYVPVNRNGDTMTGNLNLGGFDLTFVGNIVMSADKTLTLSNLTNAQQATLVSGLTSGDTGRTWYNVTTNRMMYFDGSLPQVLSSAAGSVNAVTATAPLVSSGGISPNLTLAKATAGADGYLASTDWTIFNNKQNTLAAANAATDGYLTSADWSVFNSKQAALVKSDGTHDGYLASTDWTIFNNKQNTLAAANAATDGYLTSSDWTVFNSKQAALVKSDGTHDGYLASTDWTIFNNKQNTLAAANAATDGYLTSADWTVFNSKQAALVKSDATHDGFLASTDWTTFNNKQNTLAAANAATDGYLTSSDWTVFNSKQAALVKSDGTHDGFLASTDWTTFNNKQNTLAAANAATDGYLTSADWSIFNSKQAALVKSDATHDGFLASTDWTTFNNKVSSQWSTSTDTTSVYYNGGKVGVGTDSPAEIFHVRGGNVTGIRVESTSNAPVIDLYSSSGIAASRNWRFATNYSAAGNFEIWNSNSTAGAPNAAGAMIIDSNRNFGIGSSSAPANKMDVAGGVAIGANYYGVAGPANGLIVEGDVGIRKSNPSYALDVSGDVNVTGNFKINGVNIGAGGVTAVTAGAPLASSGGGTPNITLAKATAGADGFLASTDWTTFNNKQNTLAAANAATDGYLTSADWTIFNSKQATLVKSDATHDGFLASTDWTTFNNKQNTLVKATAVADGYLSSADWTTFNNKVSSQWTTSSDGTSIYRTGGYVGIGTTTPTYPSHVRSTSSTADLNMSAQYVDMSDSGAITVGGANKAAQTASTYFTGNITRGGGGSTNAAIMGVYAPVTYTGTVNSGGLGDWPSLYGVRGTATFAGSLTDASANMFVYGVSANASGNAAGLGNLYHYGVSAAASGTGVENNGIGIQASGATTNRAVYITAPAAGANNWALYSTATAKSYLAGNLGIGVTSPSYAVDVSGDVNVTGNFKINGTNLNAGTKADATHDGYLASTDWTTFNGKQGTSLTDGFMWIGSSGTNLATPRTVSGDATISNVGLVTLSNNATARTNIGLGTGASPTFTGLTLSGLATGYVKASSGVLSVSTTLSSADITGVIDVAHGGTGLATHTSGSILIGSGAASFSSLAGGGAGNVVYATGASTWASGTPNTAGLVDLSTAQSISGDKTFTGVTTSVTGGALLLKTSTANATGTINFATGNLQHTTQDCGAYNLYNVKEGGSYTFIVKGGTVATCSFTVYSGAGSGGYAGANVHMPTDHGATTLNKHTFYSIVVAGGDVYITWMPGM